MCHHRRRHRRGPVVVVLAVAAYKRYQAHRAKATNADNERMAENSNHAFAFYSSEDEVQLPPPYEDVANVNGKEWPTAAEKGSIGI